MYNILFGGAAGDGIETTAALLEKLLKAYGMYIFSMRDFMSRVRGGHNFALLRFGGEPMHAHRDRLDILIPINEESYRLHADALGAKGRILCDSGLAIDDERAMRLDFKALAKEAGNAKAVGSVFVGALLRMFSFDFSEEIAEAVLKKQLRADLIPANMAALRAGYAAAEGVFLAPASSDLSDAMLMTGAQAMALGALAGNMRFYSAYPMSPSTTLLEFFDRQADDVGLAVEQAEDEIAALNMALGAASAGARAMTGTSGGGFSLMVEALGFAGIAEIPVVVVNVQRPGPATGLPTRTEQSDLRFMISASQGEFPRMVIAVRDQEDAFYQTERALNIAEKYQMPVILLSDQYIADSAAVFERFSMDKLFRLAPLMQEPQFDENGRYMRYAVTPSGISPRLISGDTAHESNTDSDEHDVYGNITEDAEVRIQQADKRMRKLDTLRADLQEPIFLGDANFDTLLLGFGSTYRIIEEAVRLRNAEGGKVAALLFGDVWPLPTQSLEKYAPRAKKIINVEQNMTGQLASVIREITGIETQDSLLKYDGRQLSVDEVYAKLQEKE